MRLPRVKIRGDRVYYHVMTRCVRKQMLLKGHETWIYEKIAKLCEVFYVELIYLTVMGNHYHMLISMKLPTFNLQELKRRFEILQTTHATRKPFPMTVKAISQLFNRFTDLSYFMKEVNESIAREVNRLNGSGGPVWGDRFKSVLLEDSSAVFTCMTYIAMNPVRAGIVDDPVKYPYCTTGRFELGGQEMAGTVPAPFQFLGMPIEDQPKLFSQYVSCLARYGREQVVKFPSEAEELKKLLKQHTVVDLNMLVQQRSTWLINSPVMGSPEFCEKIRKQFPALSNKIYQRTSSLYTARCVSKDKYMRAKELALSKAATKVA